MGVSIQNMVLSDHDMEIQALDACMTDFNTVSARKGGGSKVTFITPVDLDHGSVLTGNPRMQKMAFIVWLERDKAQKLLDSRLPEGVAAEHEAPLRSLLLALQHVQATAAGNDSKTLPSGKYINPLIDDLLKLFKE